MKVYSSFSNSMNFHRSKISIASMYKRYAILFDQVIFNRHGCPIGKGDLFSSLHEYVSTSASEEVELKEKLKLSNNKKFQGMFIDLWDVVDDPERAHNELPLICYSHRHSKGICSKCRLENKSKWNER